MCLTMARDLGSLGIRALAIAPSLFATGLTEGIPDEFATVLTQDAAFPKRLGKPEEAAKLAVAIVENPMLNGQCIRLDAASVSPPSAALPMSAPATAERSRARRNPILSAPTPISSKLPAIVCRP